MNKIGIDLGGTKIEGILTDESYNSISRKRIPTDQENGYNYILESIKNLVIELAQESDEKVSIGICTPGALSLDSGLIKNSNTQCLIGKDLQKDLKNILHNEVVIENDAKHLPADGSVYITNNVKYHNAFNGGEENRVHLVACLTDYKFS